jgi:hypothetical protein
VRQGWRICGRRQVCVFPLAPPPLLFLTPFLCSFGQRFLDKPFENKRFFLSQSFKLENVNKPFKIQNAKTLAVDLGRGVVTESIDDADYILVGTGDNSAASSKAKKVTWVEFIAMIPSSAEPSKPASEAPKVSSSSTTNERKVRFDGSGPDTAATTNNKLKRKQDDSDATLKLLKKNKLEAKDSVAPPVTSWTIKKPSLKPLAELDKITKKTKTSET